MKTNFLAVIAAFASFTPPVLAEEAKDVEVHAFLSQGFIKTTDNEFLAKSSRLGSFAFSEAGINFTRGIAENLRAGLQLFARHLGSAGNLEARFDWFYLDYRPSDRLGLRVGRVKLPFGLYNDSSDVDAGRAPILLPQSVYPTQNRDFLLAQTGAEIYGYSGSGPAGSLDYRAYLGTIALELPSVPGSTPQVKTLDVPYVAGGRLLWETPVEGLRVGGTLQALRLDTVLLYGATPVSGQIPAILWVGSAEYVHSSLTVAAEYARWHVKTANSSDPALLPDSSVTSERAYVMGSYRLNAWLQPALYYSILYPNVERRAGRQNLQNDLAATLRFDVNANWIVKLEGHYVRGTAGLNSALNGGASLSALTENWGAFLVKTTAYF